MRLRSTVEEDCGVRCRIDGTGNRQIEAGPIEHGDLIRHQPLTGYRSSADGREVKSAKQIVAPNANPGVAISRGNM